MACGCGNSGSVEINSTNCSTAGTCGSNATCNCGNTPCGCGSSGIAAQTPYYNSAAAVQESHCQTIVQAQYITAIKTSNSFNIPACAATAVVTFPGLATIQVGSYIWNATYGYFEVMSFDYASGQVTIKNLCAAGYASPGTAVPACAPFTVVDPTDFASGATQTGVFVASSFVAVGVGNCISIQVTNIVGLMVGGNVQIGSGIYRISDIVSPTIITICNDGDGAVAGTVVPATDASGLYITPITPISTNACTNTASLTGALLICHNNVQSPLDATMVGQIPVVVNATTNEVEFQTLDVGTTLCTPIGCLSLISGTTTYNVSVTSNVGFGVGDIVVIYAAGYETDRWIVNGFTGTTIINVTKTTPQTVTEVIGCSGSQLCLAPCCEQVQKGLTDLDVHLQTQIDTINNTTIPNLDTHLQGNIDALDTHLQGNIDTLQTSITSGTIACSSDWSSKYDVDAEGYWDTTVSLDVINAGASVYRSANIVVIQNTTCSPMGVFVTWEFNMYGYFNVYEGEWAELHLRGRIGANVVALGGPNTPVAPTDRILNNVDYNFGIGATSPQNSERSEVFTASNIYLVPTGNKIVLTGGLLVEYISFKPNSDSIFHSATPHNSQGDFYLSKAQCSIFGIGVAA